MRNTEMNAHPPSRRIRLGWSGPRRALAPATLAAIAMLVAACGGNNPSSAAGSTRYQKALAFTKCMRSHGALGFPDPTSQGTITVTQALLSNPQIRAAAPSCKRLLPRGAVQLPAGLQRKLETQALQYSACMRSHGVPNFPDPTIHNGEVGFHVAVRAPGPGPKASGAPGQNAGGNPGPNPGGAPAMPPQFQAAQRACQNLLPGGH
jgi:hypothetical protein